MLQNNLRSAAIATASLHDAHGDRKYLNRSEHVRFLDAAGDFAPMIRVFGHFMAFSGVRISEALNLPRHRVSSGEVVVRTLKQRRVVYRTIQLPAELTDEMLSLVPADNPSGRIFPVSRSTGYRLLKAIMAKAQLTGAKACPKGLRHSYGVRNVMEGVPLTTVQDWLGHESVLSTMIYTRAKGEEERALARRAWAYGR